MSELILSVIGGTFLVLNLIGIGIMIGLKVAEYIYFRDEK